MNQDDESDEISEKSSIVKWLDELYKKVKKCTKKKNDTGDRDNIMRNKGFATYLLRLCRTLPLWSCINCEHFGVEKKTASTSNVESHFNDLKHCLSDTIPCRIDEFVQEHINLIDGAVKDASQKYITYVDASKMMPTDNGR